MEICGVTVTHRRSGHGARIIFNSAGFVSTPTRATAAGLASRDLADHYNIATNFVFHVGTIASDNTDLCPVLFFLFVTRDAHRTNGKCEHEQYISVRVGGGSGII